MTEKEGGIQPFQCKTFFPFPSSISSLSFDLPIKKGSPSPSYVKISIVSVSSSTKMIMCRLLFFILPSPTGREKYTGLDYVI